MYKREAELKYGWKGIYKIIKKDKWIECGRKPHTSKNAGMGAAARPGIGWIIASFLAPGLVVVGSAGYGSFGLLQAGYINYIWWDPEIWQHKQLPCLDGVITSLIVFFFSIPTWPRCDQVPVIIDIVSHTCLEKPSRREIAFIDIILFFLEREKNSRGRYEQVAVRWGFSVCLLRGHPWLPTFSKAQKLYAGGGG